MNFEEIYKEINRQSFGSSFIEKEKKDIFQQCVVYILEGHSLEDSVKKSIRDNRIALTNPRNKIHSPIHEIDLAEEDIKPLAIKKVPFNDRKKRRIYDYFDSLGDVGSILTYLDYDFQILKPEKKSYVEGIQLLGSCPICHHKRCFTIYENNSEDRVKNIAKFSYSCHTFYREHDYKLYPNNLDGIFMLILDKPRKSVRSAVSRIIQEL